MKNCSFKDSESWMPMRNELLVDGFLDFEDVHQVICRPEHSLHKAPGDEPWR
jgi:hypothetical protein